MNEQAEKNKDIKEQNREEDENFEEQNDTPDIDIEKYPLRNASEDPRWALWVVLIWVGIALFLLIFISTLMILGFWFD